MKNMTSTPCRGCFALGCLGADGSIDEAATSTLIEAAGKDAVICFVTARAGRGPPEGKRPASRGSLSQRPR